MLMLDASCPLSGSPMKRVLDFPVDAHKVGLWDRNRRKVSGRRFAGVRPFEVDY